jgi:GntR family transcriptional regulator
VSYNTVFFLNPNSGVPLYVQLQHQLQQRILSGQLKHGAQLPSVRELSAELHINLLTVTKVYQILEHFPSLASTCELLELSLEIG